MSANQNQENQYNNRSDPLFELSSDWHILVGNEAILFNPVVNHVDIETFQKYSL
jgi:hypothetical protein